MLFSQIQNGRVILYINRPFVEEGHPAAAQINTTAPVIAQHQQHPATTTATSQPVVQQATQHLQQQQLNVERSVLSQQFSGAGSDDSIGYK